METNYYSKSPEQGNFDINESFFDKDSLFWILSLGFILSLVTGNDIGQDRSFLNDLEIVTSKSEVNNFAVSTNAAMAIGQSTGMVTVYENTAGAQVSLERIVAKVMSNIKSKSLEIVKGDVRYIYYATAKYIAMMDSEGLMESSALDISVKEMTVGQLANKALIFKDTGPFIPVITSTLQFIGGLAIDNGFLSVTESMNKALTTKASILEMSALITYSNFYAVNSYIKEGDLIVFIDALSSNIKLGESRANYYNNGDFFDPKQDLLFTDPEISVSELKGIAVKALQDNGLIYSWQ